MKNNEIEIELNNFKEKENFEEIHSNSYSYTNLILESKITKKKIESIHEEDEIVKNEKLRGLNWLLKNPNILYLVKKFIKNLKIKSPSKSFPKRNSLLFKIINDISAFQLKPIFKIRKKSLEFSIFLI